MVYHDMMKERTPGQIERHLHSLKRRKRLKTALLTLSAGFLMYVLNNVIRNYSDASTIESMIKNKEVDSTYNSLGIDLSFKKDGLLLELISDRDYLERYLELYSKYSKPNLKNMSKHASLKETAVALDDAGAQNMRDILIAGAITDSDMLKYEWSPRAIRFRYLVSAVDGIIDNFNSLESEIFTLSTRAQITRLFKNRHSADPMGDMRELTKYRRDYLLSLLPAAMFGEDAIEHKIVMAVSQAESKSDETATGRLNFLDTGKNQIQPPTAINMISRIMIRPEFEYMLRPLQLVDSTGYIGWDEFSKKIMENLDNIRNLNIENLKVNDLEQVLENYERIYAGMAPKSQSNKRTFSDEKISEVKIFSAEKYWKLQNILATKEELQEEIERMEYAINNHDQKSSYETSTISEEHKSGSLESKKRAFRKIQSEIEKILDAQTKKELQDQISALRAERNALVDNIAGNKDMNAISKYYDVLFDNKLQAILTGAYIVQDTFGREEYWQCVYNYHKKAGIPIEQAMLEFIYVGYMAGPGSFNAAYNALKMSGFKKESIPQQPGKRFGFKFVFENTYRLYKEYKKIEEYSELGMFILKPRKGDESVNIIKDQVTAVENIGLADIADSYLKKFNIK